MQPSFLSSACDASCPFPLNNLPYGSFSLKSSSPHTAPTLCVAIGDRVLDLAALADKLPAVFPGPCVPPATARTLFSSPTLNAFLALGKPAWQEVRAALQDALSASPRVPVLKDADAAVQAALLPPASAVRMHMPVGVGDYTDFYSSVHHARNVGTMFRGPDNALPPNWLHMPIAYHGRASSVVPSGTPVRRPCGQLRADAQAAGPTFGPCRLLDFELEMAAVVGGPENALGERVHVDQAGDRVFGLCLMNDWSARDIQKWEYVPLGPFGAKNFATTISPWVVPLDALHSFRRQPHQQSPDVLPYLKASTSSTSTNNNNSDGGQVRAHCMYDVELEVKVQSSGGEEPSVVCESNLKHLYWTVAQQLAHHSVTGCNMRAGDILGSGTISGPEERSFGSMLELSWKGTRKVALDKCESGTRTFLQDGDTVYMYGHARGDGFTIGFGECVGKILPAVV